MKSDTAVVLRNATEVLFNLSLFAALKITVNDREQRLRRFWEELR